MRTRCALLSLATVWFLGTPSSARASMIFNATLTGGQETPPNASAGFGTGTFTLSTDLSTLTVNSLTFGGLSALDTAAHIHCCAGPGVAAPVAISFVTAGFPLGVTSGTYSHTFTLSTDLSGIAPAAFLAALTAGNTYVNVHTTLFPGGEIRGQLGEVPEPGTSSLIAAGLLAGIFAIRRRVAGTQQAVKTSPQRRGER